MSEPDFQQRLDHCGAFIKAHRLDTPFIISTKPANHALGGLPEDRVHYHICRGGRRRESLGAPSEIFP